MNSRSVPSPSNPFMVQKTLLNAVEISGVGMHTGCNVTMKILPAAANYGIQFKRIDVKQNTLIPALWSSVTTTDFSTTIGRNDLTVSTIEHLMSAFAALEIDNAHIDISGPEVPIMDGSAQPFVNVIAKGGVQEQNHSRRFLKILKEVMVTGSDERYTSLKPSSKLSLEFTIDFAHRIGMDSQHYAFSGSLSRLRTEICPARTFGFLEDVEKMRAAGLAKGGSLDNVVVIDQGKILNPESWRYSNECVRHKILDAVGDLYTVGGPIKGAYQSKNGGHSLNNQLLQKLMSDPTAWLWEQNTEKAPQLWQPLNANMFKPLVSFG